MIECAIYMGVKNMNVSGALCINYLYRYVESIRYDKSYGVETISDYQYNQHVCIYVYIIV